MSYRFMRLIVMYDLPMNNESYIKEYSKFRKHLLNDGYVMIQYSIYSKICINKESLSLAEKRLQNIIPKIGNIRLLCMTEKQYSNMKILTGKKYKYESEQNTKRLVVL